MVLVIYSSSTSCAPTSTVPVINNSKYRCSRYFSVHAVVSSVPSPDTLRRLTVVRLTKISPNTNQSSPAFEQATAHQIYQNPRDLHDVRAIRHRAIDQSSNRTEQIIPGTRYRTGYRYRKSDKPHGLHKLGTVVSGYATPLNH
jgi:hypothetical protein